MTDRIPDAREPVSEIDALKAEIDLLKRQMPSRRLSWVTRIFSMAGVLLVASALGFGALTAAGGQALHIDAQGNVHILGIVTFGDATAAPAVVIDPDGHLTVPGDLTIGVGDTAVVASGGDLHVSGAVRVGGDTGLVLDGSGNLTVPGNLSVGGLADRLSFTSEAVPFATIQTVDVARLCGDSDGCQLRVSTYGKSDMNHPTGIASTWMHCAADCTFWRTSGVVQDAAIGKALATGESQEPFTGSLSFSIVAKIQTCRLLFLEAGAAMGLQKNAAGADVGAFSMVASDQTNDFCVLTIID
jgi:hypothetical protein